MFGKRFSRALAVTTVATLVMATAVFADNVQNTVSAETAQVGNSVTVTYRIVGNNAPNGDLAGCNVDASNPATITPGGFTSAQVTASPTSVSITDCGSPGAKSLTLTGNIAGSYEVANAISGGKAGSLWADQTGFTFVVTSANAAPVVSADQTGVSVNEGSPASMTGTWSDANALDTVTLSADIGDIQRAGTNAFGTWSWSYTPDDGPDGSQTVTVTASDGTTSATTTFDLTVDNVVPTISSFSGSPSAGLVGKNVTFTAVATDVSLADRNAGFAYSFNSGAFDVANTLTTSYVTCGLKTESVRAQDKDGGISLSSSATVSVYDGDFHGAINPAQRNLVQKGRVIPVQIRIGCGDTALTGLTPTILLANGDVAEDVDSSDPAVTAATTVSAADQTGQMRPNDSGYIYNLQIPSSASAGNKFTILVRPWGSAGPTLKALVEIRK